MINIHGHRNDHPMSRVVVDACVDFTARVSVTKIRDKKTNGGLYLVNNDLRELHLLK